MRKFLMAAAATLTLAASPAIEGVGRKAKISNTLRSSFSPRIWRNSSRLTGGLRLARFGFAPFPCDDHISTLLVLDPLPHTFLQSKNILQRSRPGFDARQLSGGQHPYGPD